MRIGVAGAGHLGFHHARIYAQMDGITLAGVVDPRDAARERVQTELGATVYTTPDKLLEQGVDAVSIATPTTTHHEIASMCLEAGADVLVEKPITATVEEAHALVRLARERERVLQVGHVERFNGAVTALLDAFNDPRFIECHRLSPFPMRGTDVSVVHDLMIHDLDVLLALIKSEVTSVDAAGIAIFSPAEDIANVRLHFASGAVANLTASRVSMDRMRKIRVFGNDAYASTDYSAQEVLVYKKKPGDPPPDMNPMGWIEVTPLDVSKDEPLKRELEAFVHSVRTREEPVVPGEDGLRALELVEWIVRDLREKLAR